MTHPHRLSVLVVDDHADAADSLADLMALHGRAARAAHSGADALRLAAEDRPDVVFLDLLMPGLDGWQVTERLRAADRRLVVVGVTGLAGDQARNRSTAARIPYHLTKPVEPARLLRLVELAGDAKRGGAAAGGT